MTCFWDAILHGLSNINICFDNQINFVKYLKNNNKKTTNVIPINTPLSEKRLEENFTSISNYNENSIYEGYLCSSIDPFLLLISELYNINIYHNFNGSNIDYIHNNPKYELYLVSSMTHCSFVKIVLINKN